jgi:hypothetical protein
MIRRPEFNNQCATLMEIPSQNSNEVCVALEAPTEGAAALVLRVQLQNLAINLVS